MVISDLLKFIMIRVFHDFLIERKRVYNDLFYFNVTKEKHLEIILGNNRREFRFECRLHCAELN